jgi:hypothetical protein
MGVTRRNYKTYWTETKRVVGGEVKVVVCCCSSPGATRKECAASRNLKNPCRCYCHDAKK